MPSLIMIHQSFVFTCMYESQVPTVMSTATMKVQTTVFVGNISEKASDTLVRQILLVS